ncbi:hypothetical protein GCM10028895_18370 [Pontibacter rugosus]
MYGEVDVNYNLFPMLAHTPYLQIGGALSTGGNLGDALGNVSFNNLNSYVKAGLGVEFMASKRFGVEANVFSSYMLNDTMDEVQRGRFNDYYWGGKVGVNYYLNLFK